MPIATIISWEEASNVLAWKIPVERARDLVAARRPRIAGSLSVQGRAVRRTVRVRTPESISCSFWRS